MNFLKFYQEDNGQNNVKNQIHLNWLVYSLVIALGALYILATCSESYASVPDTATINKLSPPVPGNKQPSVRRGSDTVHQLAKPKDILHSRLNESVIVPAKTAWAHLIFNDHNGTLVQVGPGNTTSEYSFPCRTTNHTIIGWSLRNADSGECLTMRVSDGVPWVSQLSHPISTYTAQTTKDILNITDATKSLLIVQNSVPQVQYYCGAVANSKEGQWGISVGSPSLEAACNEAKQKCSAATTNGECSVVSLGDWKVNDPEIIASMVCISSKPGLDNKPVSLLNSQRGNGSTVEEMLGWLEKRNKHLKSTACVPSVYSSDDAIVSPTTLEPTLIQSRIVDGNLAIDVLAGSVNIVSASRPDGLFLEKGFGYRHQETKLDRLDCPSIFESQPIQDFLEDNNWSSDVAPQLDGYRKAFCQSGGQQGQTSASKPRLIINTVRIFTGNSGSENSGNSDSVESGE